MVAFLFFDAISAFEPFLILFYVKAVIFRLSISLRSVDRIQHRNRFSLAQKHFDNRCPDQRVRFYVRCLDPTFNKFDQELTYESLFALISRPHVFSVNNFPRFITRTLKKTCLGMMMPFLWMIFKFSLSSKLMKDNFCTQIWGNP